MANFRWHGISWHRTLVRCDPVKAPGQERVLQLIRRNSTAYVDVVLAWCHADLTDVSVVTQMPGCARMLSESPVLISGTLFPWSSICIRASRAQIRPNPAISSDSPYNISGIVINVQVHTMVTRWSSSNSLVGNSRLDLPSAPTRSLKHSRSMPSNTIKKSFGLTRRRLFQEKVISNYARKEEKYHRLSSFCMCHVPFSLR